MQMRGIHSLVLIFVLAAGALAVLACGDDEEAPAKDAPASPAASGVAAPAAAAAAVAPTPSAAPVPAAAPAPGEDPEKECRLTTYCERKCSKECLDEEYDRTAFFAAKRQRIAESPFEVKINRAYLSGSCAKGDDPLKRRSASGVRAVIEGVMTYNGDDMLYSAGLGGEMYAKMGPTRYAEVGVKEKAYSGGWYRRLTYVSRFNREVRGADPWFKGQTRPFHWESESLSEAFCEVIPQEAKAYIEVWTRGMYSGRHDYPAAFVQLHWDEILGMALRQQVKIEVKKKNEVLEEPADAHYAQLDRILVTRLTGKTEWLKRSMVIDGGEVKRGPAATFPVESETEDWSIKINAITQDKEFGGYAHKGEDQFLAIVDVTIGYNGEGEGSLKKFGLRLETTPGKWQKPQTKAMGQLDMSASVPSGGTVSGKVVFPRQRFERPFRIEVKTPDKNTVFLDVLSYDIGPKRAPEK